MPFRNVIKLAVNNVWSDFRYKAGYLPTIARYTCSSRHGREFWSLIRQTCFSVYWLQPVLSILYFVQGQTSGAACVSDRCKSFSDFCRCTAFTVHLCCNPCFRYYSKPVRALNLWLFQPGFTEQIAVDGLLTVILAESEEKTGNSSGRPSWNCR